MGCLDSPAVDAADPAENRLLRFGVVTDVHYADADTKGSRHYRDSLQKLRLAIDTFNRREVVLVVELGDLIDAGGTREDELKYLPRSTRSTKGSAASGTMCWETTA